MPVFLQCSGHHRHLHSFPTRRSSDLSLRGPAVELGVHVDEPAPVDHVVRGIGDVPDYVINGDRKSTRLNSSHVAISYAVFCLKKKKLPPRHPSQTLRHLMALELVDRR